MHREIDAIQTKVVAVLKDFNDWMKKLFGEAQNTCSVWVHGYWPQPGSPSAPPEQKVQPFSHARTGARPQPRCCSMPAACHTAQGRRSAWRRGCGSPTPPPISLKPLLESSPSWDTLFLSGFSNIRSILKTPSWITIGLKRFVHSCAGSRTLPSWRILDHECGWCTCTFSLCPWHSCTLTSSLWTWTRVFRKPGPLQ